MAAVQTVRCLQLQRQIHTEMDNSDNEAVKAAAKTLAELKNIVDRAADDDVNKG